MLDWVDLSWNASEIAIAACPALDVSWDECQPVSLQLHAPTGIGRLWKVSNLLCGRMLLPFLCKATWSATALSASGLPFAFLSPNLGVRPDTFLAMNASFSSRTQDVSSSSAMKPCCPSLLSAQKPSSPLCSPCFRELEGLVASTRSDGWILDGGSGCDEEIVTLWRQHVVEFVFERGIPQIHCPAPSFSLLIWQFTLDDKPLCNEIVTGWKCVPVFCVRVIDVLSQYLWIICGNVGNAGGVLLAKLISAKTTHEPQHVLPKSCVLPKFRMCTWYMFSTKCFTRSVHSFGVHQHDPLEIGPGTLPGSMFQIKMSSSGDSFVEAYSSAGITEATLNLLMSHHRTEKSSGSGAGNLWMIQRRLVGDAYTCEKVLDRSRRRSQLSQEHTEETLPEGSDQRVSVPTLQFLQSSTTELGVPHIRIKILHPSQTEGILE